MGNSEFAAFEIKKSQTYKKRDINLSVKDERSLYKQDLYTILNFNRIR